MLSINISLKKISSYTDDRQINVRVFSEWLPCSFTTPNFGEEWKESEEDGFMISTFNTNVDCDITSPENIQLFNEKPSIYAVVLGDNAPFGFSVVDCSSFAIEAGTACAKNSQNGEYQLDISVTINKPLIALADAIALEPLVLDIKSVSAYPVLENESLEEAVKSSYLYGEFDLGGGVKRKILGFPYVYYEEPTSTNTTEIISNETDLTKKNAKMNINLKICLLPGLTNLSKLRDSLVSTTLVLELHNENIFTRTFHQRNIIEYMELYEQLNKQAEEIPIDIPKKANKPPVAAASGKKDLPIENNILSKIEVTEMIETDHFLLNCIHRSLVASRCIRPHGIIRYRLEQLLSTSNDLLTKFARMRNNGLPLPGDDTIVVEEDMLVEVRLEKPSKPEKWELPADMSLKAALQRAKLEMQSKLDGTLAGTNSSSLPNINKTAPGRSQTVSGLMLTKPTPRHELFLVNNTAVEITAALHRSLIVPKTAGFKSATPGKQPSPSPSASALSPGPTSPLLSPLSDRELEEKLLVTPFTRMIVLFKYQNDEILRAIGRGLEAINSAALPDIQGSLRSYSFTETEINEIKDAKLDIITGFMIIDDDWRFVVLEGLAAYNHGMFKMFTEYLPKIQENNEYMKILCNPEVLFPDRLYPEFGPDIRRIRIRDKLKKLARRPEVYNRKQVEEICFQAIDNIMILKRAQDMLSTKKLNMYPTSESLNKLELLYGEAITRADMDGTLRDQFMENYDRQQKQQQQRLDTPKTPINMNSKEKLLTTTTNSNTITTTHIHRRNAYQPTDCRNPSFEEYLHTRPLHRINYMEETKIHHKMAWNEMLKRREKRDIAYETNLCAVLGENVYKDMIHHNITPKIYLYSQQKHNFKEKAYELLRQRIGNDKNATYTFSKDFVSQTICVVDEEKLIKNEKIKSKSEYLTPSGFQYPKPKTTKELILHPDRPSDARIEDLKEPFHDLLDIPASANTTADPMLREREKGFKTQIPSNGLFGSLKPVTFEHEFELKLVGNREKLPRGGLTGGTEIDPQAFRSVHLGGDQQTRIIAEALEKEKKDWNDKVVVDNLSIKVGGFKVRDKPLQVNRTQDILHDEPKRKELINLRHRTSHKGDDWSYTPAPLSILNAEPYVSNQSATALLRTTNPDKFITSGKLVLSSSATRNNKHTTHTLQRNNSFSSADSDSVSNNDDDNQYGNAQLRGSSSKPLDFTRYIHKDTFNPKLMSAIARRKHPPQDRNSAECTGPKWDAAAATATSTTNHK